MCSKAQTVEKVVEIPQVGQTLQGTTQEVDMPLAEASRDPGIRVWDSVSIFGDAHILVI